MLNIGDSGGISLHPDWTFAPLIEAGIRYYGKLEKGIKEQGGIE
jgi:hypothetical protein